ncbi:MAG: hypothetical protein QNJ46_29040 [Leptolyngbyaceae cyanobacterium MO_188.B28]|nr:hypothetical protein [Leptolyngbyaceae cyanobacterium MO_188.B28]
MALSAPIPPEKIQHEIRQSNRGGWRLIVWESCSSSLFQKKSFIWKLNLPLTGPEKAEEMLQMIFRNYLQPQ